MTHRLAVKPPCLTAGLCANAAIQETLGAVHALLQNATDASLRRARYRALLGWAEWARQHALPDYLRLDKAGIYQPRSSRSPHGLVGLMGADIERLATALSAEADSASTRL